MKNEIFKDIPGYEGIYAVSNLGTLKSLRTWCPNNGTFIKKEKILNSWKNNCGYMVRLLVKNGVKKCYSIHRLVAMTFIPNTKNLSDVDHINGDKTDNRAENLQWLTHKENLAKVYSKKHSIAG